MASGSAKRVSRASADRRTVSMAVLTRTSRLQGVWGPGAAGDVGPTGQCSARPCRSSCTAGRWPADRSSAAPASLRASDRIGSWEPSGHVPDVRPPRRRVGPGESALESALFFSDWSHVATTFVDLGVPADLVAVLGRRRSSSRSHPGRHPARRLTVTTSAVGPRPARARPSPSGWCWRSGPHRPASAPAGPGARAHP